MVNRKIWSGKTTLVLATKELLDSRKIPCVILDGDDLRAGLNNDLGFSKKDRTENVRRLSEISKILLSQDIIPIVAAITPFHEMRDLARDLLNDKYVEVHVKASFDICARRDPKGLYKKYAEDKKSLEMFDAYDIPEKSHITIPTAELTVTESINKIINEVSIHLGFFGGEGI